jgi:hypothetical protein
MMVVKAEFDGHAFVPSEKVELPIGTQVEVVVLTPPPAPTPEEDQKWQVILQHLQASEPHFSSVEEAMRYTRKRP